MIAAGARSDGFGAWPYGTEPNGEGTADGDLSLRLIPYHRWAERGPSTMRVWLPEQGARVGSSRPPVFDRGSGEHQAVRPPALVSGCAKLNCSSVHDGGMFRPEVTGFCSDIREAVLQSSTNVGMDPFGQG